MRSVETSRYRDVLSASPERRLLRSPVAACEWPLSLPVSIDTPRTYTHVVLFIEAQAENLDHLTIIVPDGICSGASNSGG